MVRLALKRLVHNRSLSAALLLAAVLCVAALSSVPVYTRGVLQKLLRADLEGLQHAGATFPGRLHAEIDFSRPARGGDGFARYQAVDAEVGRLVEDLAVPVLAGTQQLTLGPVFFHPHGRPGARRLIKVEALSGLADHVRITRGRLFAGARTDAPPGAAYEAIVTEHAVAQLDLLLGATYQLDRTSPDGTGPMAVTVVGVFAVADERDPFWFLPLRFYDDSFLVDDGRFRRELLHAGSEGLKAAQWHYALDYHHLTVGDLPRVERLLDAYGRRAAAARLRWRVAFGDTLVTYRERAQRLQMTLWFLQVPMLVVLLLFTQAIARARVESERIELATFISRGAHRRQLAKRTLVEGGLLAVAALLTGLPAGLVLSRLVGASAGFLTFVRRQALPATFDARVLGAGAAGALLFLLFMLGSSLRHARRSIVQQERAVATGTLQPRRAGMAAAIGTALVAAALYGLLRVSAREAILARTGVSGAHLPLDPLLFAGAVLFTLGLSLLFVAVFPYLAQMVFRSGRRIWSPVWFGALARLGRAGGERMSVMLFLTLAFAFGVFFSITARTVNAAVEDRIRYRAGADLVIEPLWLRRPAAAVGGPGGDRYVEPDLHRYSAIDGIERITGVLRRSGVTAVIGDGRGTVVELMGVVPDGFAQVAWFRTGLLPAHGNHYLNLLATDSRAMLLSSTLQRSHGIEIGDPVRLTWAGQAPLSGHAAAFVDFWPAYDPHRDHLVVANLAYVHARMQIEPYELWAERANGANNRTILDGIDRAGVRITDLTDTGAKISAARRDPMTLGLNGTLTIGFLLVTGIAAAAFVIAAAISLRSRQAELAVVRSIGLSRRRVVAMVGWEQFLMALSAVIAGVVLGAVAARIYVPTMQVVTAAAERVPPLRVVALTGDFVRLYAIAAATFVAGALVVRGLIGRLRIHEAIRLGQE